MIRLLMASASLGVLIGVGGVYLALLYGGDALVGF
jgi:hypothetical protein